MGSFYKCPIKKVLLQNILINDKIGLILYFQFFRPSCLFICHCFKGSLVVGGCTIPGCYYPHFFSHHVNSSVIKAMRVRGGRLSCHHVGRGTPGNRIECQLKCKKGWKNSNNIDITICTKSQVEALASIKNLTGSALHSPNGLLQKTTNFTTDYLECRRDVIQSKMELHQVVSTQKPLLLTSTAPSIDELINEFDRVLNRWAPGKNVTQNQE